MRKLIWIVLIFAGLYGGYWFVGSRAALKGMEVALDQMKDEGLGNYQSVTLTGFPSRFDITIDKPELVSGDGRTSWSADFLQLLALSYRPNQVIAVWPKEQTLTIDGQKIKIGAEDLRASVATEPMLSLPLDHAELEGHALRVGLPLGAVTVEKLVVAVRQGPRGLNNHDLALVATRPGPDALLRAIFDPKGALPPQADELTIKANATFDRRLDRSAFETPPRLTTLQEIDARLLWGKAQFIVTGDLQADAQGFAQGDLQVTAEEWEQVFAIATGLGLVPPDQIQQMHQMLSVMAQGADKPGSLSVPLHFEDGMISIGALYLGAAPRF